MRISHFAVIGCCLAFAGFSLSANASAQQPKNDAVLQQLLREAEENNPELRQAFQEWKAAEHQVEVAKGLPDPVAGYGFFVEEIQTRLGPQEHKFSLSQKVPFPGKRRLMGKAQNQQAEILRQRYHSLQSDLVNQVQDIYYDLYWIDRSIAITEEEKSILEKLENVAQRRYESNITPQQDVIKAQVQLSKSLEKTFLLRQNRQSLNARLNALLNRAADHVQPAITAIPDKAFEQTLEEVLELTRQRRPELQAAATAVKKAEYEKSLAEMAYWPDITFGAEYTEIGSGTTPLRNDGEDAWMGKISFNIPFWFQKLKAQVRAKEASLAAARYQQTAATNQAENQARDLYFKVNAYKDIVKLYETALLPQAEQAFEASQSGFESDSISFLDWLDTERTYLQTRLAYSKAVTDYHKSIADLENIIGTNIKEASDEN